MEQEKNTVLYIYGFGRSGSTVLARALGQVKEICNVGELRWVWEQGFVGNHLCGCGTPFKECEFWSAVAQDAYGGFDRLDLDQVGRLTEVYPWNRSRPMGQRLRYVGQQAITRKSPGYVAQLPEHAQLLSNLYSAIRKVSGKRIILDSSKDPSYLHMLSALPDIDLHIVHIVRDSRAVAFSWLKEKVQPEIQDRVVHMPRIGSAGSALLWMLYNGPYINRIKQRQPSYLFLRYDDFVADPRGSVARIVDLVHEEATGSQIVDNRIVDLTADHTVSGNPMRFDQGTIELRLDEEWRTRMKPMDKKTVTAMTWPSLVKYGYIGKTARKPETAREGLTTRS